MPKKIIPPEIPEKGRKIRIWLGDEFQTAIVDCHARNCEGVWIIHLQTFDGHAWDDFLKYFPDKSWGYVLTQDTIRVRVELLTS